LYDLKITNGYIDKTLEVCQHF